MTDELVPKNFKIKCIRCSWSMLTSGVSADLVGVYEIKKNCENCGGARKFRCKKCGGLAEMKRIRGNIESSPPPVEEQ